MFKKINLKFVLPVLILLFFTSGAVWFIKPLKLKKTLTPTDVTQKTTLDCREVNSSYLYTNLNLTEKSKNDWVEGSVAYNGLSLKVEINEKDLFVTIDPELSSNKPKKVWPITRNTSDYLLSSGLVKGDTNEYLSNLVVNKKTGYAVWSRSEANSLNSTLPSSTAYYLLCK